VTAKWLSSWLKSAKQETKQESNTSAPGRHNLAKLGEGSQTDDITVWLVRIFQSLYIRTYIYMHRKPDFWIFQKQNAITGSF
jgi:hypothetical protein